MGCGCKNKQQPQPTASIQAESTDPCRYSESQLREWRRLLACSKSSPQFPSLGISMVTIDRALIVVDNALAVIYNPCHYETDLNDIQGTIFQIINAGICR